MTRTTSNVQKLCVLLSLPIFLLAARFLPWHKIPSVCMFYRLTGLPCPSCGMTRSVLALTHLDFHTAMIFNPLGPVFVGFFILWWGLSVYHMGTGRRVRLLEWAGSHVSLLAIIGTVVLFVFGGMRILILVGW